MTKESDSRIARKTLVIVIASILVAAMAILSTLLLVRGNSEPINTVPAASPSSSDTKILQLTVTETKIAADGGLDSLDPDRVKSFSELDLSPP